jgi:hypothetical protein
MILICNAHINFSDTKKIKWIMGGKNKILPKAHIGEHHENST